MNFCPDAIFQQASNGLNLFLGEYPHMDATQREKIREVIELYAKPFVRRGIVRRQALQCKIGPDGVILIAPWTVRTVENRQKTLIKKP